MKIMNKGKFFEEQFKKNAISQGIFIHRLRDTNTSFSTMNSKFTHDNPCDFFCFFPIEMSGAGLLYALELKSTKYKSISIQTKPEGQGMIQMSQIKKLIDLSLFRGVKSGFVLNFREENEGRESTYFISIENFSNFLRDTDKASINKADIIMYGGVIIETEKKRTLFRYDIRKFLEEINNLRKGEE